MVESTLVPGILGGRLYSVDDGGLVAVNAEAYGMLGWRDGALVPIALNGAAPPSGPVGSTFVSFSHPVVDDGKVHFLAALSNLPADAPVRVYEWSEASGLQELNLPDLCCFTVPAPGQGGLFIGATDPLDPLDERAIWFRDPRNPLVEYFRQDTPVPGAPPGTYWLTPFHQLGVQSDSIVIRGSDNTFAVRGLFRVSPTSIEPVLLEGEPDPGSGAPVEAIWPEYSADGDRIAFRTLHPAPLFGITLVLQQADRTLRFLLTVGDVLDGLEVRYLETTHGALSGDRVGIEVWNENETGIWIADLAGARVPSALEIPTLGSVALVAFALLLGVVGTLHVVLRPGSSRRG